MKKLLVSAAVLFSLSVHAQSDKFMNAMKQNLALFDSAKTTADFVAVSAAFERIGDAEKTQWLPYYYAALSLTLPAWTDANIDKDKNSDKIKALCDKAEALTADNSDKSELEAIRNMAATQQMMVDPQSRYMTYGMEAGDALQKGMALDPNNPRLYYLQAQSIFNTPTQFGGGHDKAKPLFEKALELYKAAQPKPLYPNWGQQQTEQMIPLCDK